MEKVTYQDLGTITYQSAWDHQIQLLKEIVDNKLKNRKLPKDSPVRVATKHYLLLCEHPPVYTLGKSGSIDNLLLNDQQLKEQGFEFFKINRGGDITYHGPGQVVGYPIFDLDDFFTDIHRYVRYLEEVIIRTLAEYGIEGTRLDGFTGVWLVPKEDLPKRKICAIGVHLKHWVTMHGFAFNVNSNLSHFKNIIPCGIDDGDKDVTSLEQELGHSVPINEVKSKIKYHFADLFGFEFV